MNRNPISQKALSLFLSIALMLSIFGIDTVGVHADTDDDSHINDSQIVLDLDSGNIIFSKSNGDSYTFDSLSNPNRCFHEFDSNANIVIRQNSKSPTTHTILDLGTNYPLNLTLDGVNIDASQGPEPLLPDNDPDNIAKHCAFCLSSYLGLSASAYPAVNLTLKDSNYLKSDTFFAGLEVDEKQDLNVNGSGSLTVTGGLGAAGIGGAAEINNFTVSDSVHLQDYPHGCGTIGILGGTVTAYGGDTGTEDGINVYGGAGIGGGGAGYRGHSAGDCGKVTISDGKVTANGNGGGAGIGGGASYIGNNGGSGGKVTITGGTVEANGSTALIRNGIVNDILRSAGIGGGSIGADGSHRGGDGGTVKIYGGTVTARSSGAAMEQTNAPHLDGYTYLGTFSQGNEPYDLYCAQDNSDFKVVPKNGDSNSSYFVPEQTDGAAIGSGGCPYNYRWNHLIGDGGAITISGGTVTAESTPTNSSVIGGVGIGDSEMPFNVWHPTGTPYTPNGTCKFTGGSINTNLTGDLAVAPAPTNGSSPVYKTTSVLTDISTPTAVTVTPADGSASFPAKTDENGKLYVWLPATGSNAVLYHAAIDGTTLTYEAKGTVTTDGASQLTVLRTDPGLDNLTFNGKQASPTSTPGTYQVNVSSATTEIAIQKSPTSDLQYTVNNGTSHSGTDSVTVPISALKTDLSIHIVAPDNTAKDYTVRVMRAGRNDTALASLAVNGTPQIPDANGAYRADVANSIASVKVCAVPDDRDASYTVQANGRTLTPGFDGADVTLGDMGTTTDITIVVCAENGTTQKTYHLFLSRAAVLRRRQRRHPHLHQNPLHTILPRLPCPPP